MILRLSNFTRELSWNENCHLNELVIEHPYFYRTIIQELCSPGNDLQSISLTSDGNLLKIGDDVDVIMNPMKLDFNNRKVVANLLKALLRTSVSEDFYSETNMLKSKIINYLEDVIAAEGFRFEIETDDFSLDQIAKAVNLHVVSDEDDLVELITNYLEIMRELSKTRLFCFISLRNFLDEQELLRLYRNVCDRDFDVLLIEGSCRNPIPGVQRMIIDEDFCEI